MRPAATLSLFGAGVVAVFAAALGVGGAVGPVADDQPVRTHAGADAMAADHTTEPDAATGSALPGLAVSEAGWSLRLAGDRATAGAAVPLRFTVDGPGGAPETHYVRTHTKDLHLVVVRRDLSTFQHLHPTLGADGTWSTPVDLTAPGTYRVLADFRPRGLDRRLTLGADLAVAGGFVPEPLPAPEASADSGDGYRVTLSGTPIAGRESDLVLTVSRNGRPVTRLQPYLGAFGHLVALRHGDLAYLHTHPSDEELGRHGGPDIGFMTTFPSAGSYRLFLDFRVLGVVRTAAFTVEVAA